MTDLTSLEKASQGIFLRWAWGGALFLGAMAALGIYALDELEWLGFDGHTSFSSYTFWVIVSILLGRITVANEVAMHHSIQYLINNRTD